MKTKLLLMMILTCTVSNASVNNVYNHLENDEQRKEYATRKIESNESKAAIFWIEAAEATSEEEAIFLTERASHKENQAQIYQKLLNDLLNPAENQPDTSKDEELAQDLYISLNLNEAVLLPTFLPVEAPRDIPLSINEIAMDLKHLREATLLEFCPEFTEFERAVNEMEEKPETYIQLDGPEQYRRILSDYKLHIEEATKKTNDKLTREYMEEYLLQKMQDQNIPNLLEKIKSSLDDLGL